MRFFDLLMLYSAATGTFGLSPGTPTPELNFNVAANSQYLALLEDF